MVKFIVCWILVVYLFMILGMVVKLVDVLEKDNHLKKSSKSDIAFIGFVIVLFHPFILGAAIGKWAIKQSGK